MYESASLRVGLSLLVTASLGLAACGGESPAPNKSSSPPTAGTTVSPRAVPECRGGRLAEYKETGFSKDGKIFSVTRIEGASCAAIYDGISLKTYGSVAVGDTVTSSCWYDDSPNRLRAIETSATEDLVGDISLTESGVAAAKANKLPTCNPEDPDTVFIYPHSSSVPASGIPS